MACGLATGLPVVVLRMQNGRCPFVTKKGCRIYNDRPTPCRLYPLVRVKTGDDVQYYLLVEDFCRGHEEGRWWSIEEWIEDQQVEEYNRMNDLFFELIAAGRGRELPEEKLKKIYEVCFDVDRFKNITGIENDAEAIVAGIRYAIEIVKH